MGILSWIVFGLVVGVVAKLTCSVPAPAANEPVVSERARVGAPGREQHGR